MNEDKVIRVSNDDERRQWQRRREDQVRTIEKMADVLARERRYALLNAACTLRIQIGFDRGNQSAVEACVEFAEQILDFIEKREQQRLEHQRKDENHG